jgi:capsule polysaccharide export protein KpsE/RkpR
MSQIAPANHSEPLPDSGDGAPDIILQYWRIILRRKIPIAIVTFGAMILAGSITVFVLPKIYESTVTLAPQVDSGMGGGLSSILAKAAGGVENAAQSMGISLPGAPATPTDMLLAILKSRVMADSVIEKFKLKELYEIETMDKTRKALAGATGISLTREKVIKVVVEDEDPQRAADMANFYVSELDRLNQTVIVSKAAHTRKFLQNQLQEMQNKLRQSEEALKEFQTANKAIGMEAQSHGLFEATAAIQNQIMAQQIELEIKESFLSQNNPEVERIRSVISELRKQLEALATGKSGKGMLRGDRLQPALTAVPTLALQYGRLLRQVKEQEAMLMLMSAEYQQARYLEAHDTPTVQILDPAVPADVKKGPSGTINTLFAGLAAMICSICWALWVENRDRRKADPIEMGLGKAA